jgi:hypothetical protein
MDKIIKCNGNVVIYENFLSEQESKDLTSFMDNFDYDNLPEHSFKFWGKRLINESNMKVTPGYENALDPIRDLLSEIIKRINTVLNEFDHEDKWEPSPHNLIKMYPDSNPLDFSGSDFLEMFVHIDNQEHMEKPILWGAVLYINDNYTGGEIYYPDYEYEYKPKSGSIVFHSGQTKHGVKKVTEGNRYCAASLVTIEGFYNQRPRPARTDNPEQPYFYPPGYWGKRMSDDPIQGEVKVPRSDGTTAPYEENPVVAAAI